MKPSSNEVASDAVSNKVMNKKRKKTKKKSSKSQIEDQFMTLDKTPSELQELLNSEMGPQEL